MIAGFTGFFSFLSLNLTGTLISVYVIFFGLTLFLFECRLKKMEDKIRLNFGFLYSFKGRAGFLFFIGFLDFGLSSTFAFLVGILFCLTSLFNLLIMCTHPEFKSGNDDPTKGYSSGNQEAAKYLANNPTLAASALKATAGNMS